MGQDEPLQTKGEGLRIIGGGKKEFTEREKGCARDREGITGSAESELT